MTQNGYWFFSFIRYICSADDYIVEEICKQKKLIIVMYQSKPYIPSAAFWFIKGCFLFSILSTVGLDSFIIGVIIHFLGCSWMSNEQYYYTYWHRYDKQVRWCENNEYLLIMQHWWRQRNYIITLCINVLMISNIINLS